MTDHDFDSSLQLPLVPPPALVRGNRRAENGTPESRLPQDRVQPQRDILLARIGCVHLAAPPLPEFLPDVGDEHTLLRVETILREVLGGCDQEPHMLFCLWVKSARPDALEAIGMVGIDEERVEQNAHYALVAPMRADRGPDVLFEFSVGRCEFLVHLD